MSWIGQRPYHLTYRIPGLRADGRDTWRGANYKTEANARKGVERIRREHPDWMIVGLYHLSTELPLDPS